MVYFLYNIYPPLLHFFLFALKLFSCKLLDDCFRKFAHTNGNVELLLCFKLFCPVSNCCPKDLQLFNQFFSIPISSCWYICWAYCFVLCFWPFVVMDIVIRYIGYIVCIKYIILNIAVLLHLISLFIQVCYSLKRFLNFFKTI